MVCPLLRSVTEVMQPVRFDSPMEFEGLGLRSASACCSPAYRVREDGKVAHASAATTLSEAQQRADELRSELERREVHPDVLHFCRAELLQHNYFRTVLEASKSVAEKLRDRSGEHSDGAGLVDKCCSLSSGPIIAFNELATEWERSEETGLGTLLKGLFGTFRNPTAHARSVPSAGASTDEDLRSSPIPTSCGAPPPARRQAEVSEERAGG